MDQFWIGSTGMLKMPNYCEQSFEFKMLHFFSIYCKQ